MYDVAQETWILLVLPKFIAGAPGMAQVGHVQLWKPVFGEVR